MPRCSLDRCGGEISGLRLCSPSTYILKEIARFCDPNCRGDVRKVLLDFPVRDYNLAKDGDEHVDHIPGP